MIDLSQLSYHIVGRNNLMQDEIPLKNKVFSAWYDLWNQTYKSVDPNYLLKSEEFERQDLVTFILYQDQVAAAHLYSFYNLDSVSCMKTHYFQFFSEHYLKTLREHQVKTTMSMEYLTVLPEFRKSITGVSLASTIIQLGTYVWREANGDAIIAPARNDVKVNKMTYDVGFRCVEKDTEQRGFICDLIACFRGDAKPSEYPDVRKTADSLWDNRTIYPSAFQIMSAGSAPSQTGKRAA